MTAANATLGAFSGTLLSSQSGATYLTSPASQHTKRANEEKHVGSVRLSGQYDVGGPGSVKSVKSTNELYWKRFSAPGALTKGLSPSMCIRREERSADVPVLFSQVIHYTRLSDADRTISATQYNQKRRFTTTDANYFCTL